MIDAKSDDESETKFDELKGKYSRIANLSLIQWRGLPAKAREKELELISEIDLGDAGTLGALGASGSTGSRDLDLHRLVEGLSKDNGIFVEDNIRSKAADLFGSTTLSRLQARCLHDLVLLSSPHGTPADQIQLGVARLCTTVQENFADYVRGLYDLTRSKIQDPSDVLGKNPWVEQKEILWQNIGASFALVKADRNVGTLLTKVLFANPKKKHEMDPFLRSDGPGLSVIMWLATKKFVDELECDCRGKIDLLLPTLRAVVMGAEVKRSSGAIGEAKRQLIIRFKLISFILGRVYGIPSASTIFIGRVFYSHVAEGSKPADSEDGSGNDLEILSFYYHRM